MFLDPADLDIDDANDVAVDNPEFVILDDLEGLDSRIALDEHDEVAHIVVEKIEGQLLQIAQIVLIEAGDPP